MRRYGILGTSISVVACFKYFPNLCLKGQTKTRKEDSSVGILTNIRTNSTLSTKRDYCPLHGSSRVVFYLKSDLISI
jgi:hypothetical protein